MLIILADVAGHPGTAVRRDPIRDSGIRSRSRADCRRWFPGTIDGGDLCVYPAQYTDSFRIKPGFICQWKMFSASVQVKIDQLVSLWMFRTLCAWSSYELSQTNYRNVWCFAIFWNYFVQNLVVAYYIHLAISGGMSFSQTSTKHGHVSLAPLAASFIAKTITSHAPASRIEPLYIQLKSTFSVLPISVATREKLTPTPVSV